MSAPVPRPLVLGAADGEPSRIVPQAPGISPIHPAPEMVGINVVKAIEAVEANVRRYDPNADVAMVRRAYEFAEQHHSGQRRRSGDPYVVHPVAVAKILSELRLDVASICAGLLHDCIEDTIATAADVGRLFGPDVQFLVDGVTKLGQIPWNTREEKQAENFRKMLLAMAKDIRVILIKLADRVDNMRTLQPMARDKQERISRETREIYAPMANRLGIQWMKAELEDLAFRYLEPEDFARLEAKLAGTEASRAAYISEVCAKLREVNQEAEVPAEVFGRIKHLWSIFQKMRKNGRDVDQIYDIIAFRVITDSVKNCYAALGVVHSHWTPIPGRFKDFIALPKPNLYQSLHTTVIGPRSEKIEVQIRTAEMQSTAEQGIAAHWRYKEANADGHFDGRNLSASDSKTFAWLHQLMEWQRDLKDPTEFIESVKTDLFEEEVFVFTPKGDVKALPKGSTPIDLAYAVHSKVGDHCSGARVNGIIVPLRYQMRNGDTVEILTSNNQKPSKDWLKFVVTSRAKTKIRYHLRTEQRERGKKLGYDLLMRAMRKRDRSLAVAEKEGRLETAAHTLRLTASEDLLVAIGYGKITPDQGALAVYPADAPASDEARQNVEADLTALSTRRAQKRSVGGVRVQGEADIVVKFAKCCDPVPGDTIVAFISRGRGVIVHTRACPKTLELDPERRVDVSWDEGSNTMRPVTVEVITTDKPGILAAISRCFTEQGVNIAQAKCRTTEDHRGINSFQVMVNHVDQLQAVIRSIQGVKGVVSVLRS